MNKKIKMSKMSKIMTGILLSVFCFGITIASAGNMKKHNMQNMNHPGGFGDLIHQSTVEGYILSYYHMDLRHQNHGVQGMNTGSMKNMKAGTAGNMKSRTMPTMNTGTMENNMLDKPDHIMVYIMDKNHNPVLKGRVGFMIKDAGGHSQKAMAMFMSRGFGTTFNMKKKGVYTIVSKAIVDNKKLMDRFQYEIK